MTTMVPLMAVASAMCAQAISPVYTVSSAMHLRRASAVKLRQHVGKVPLETEVTRRAARRRISAVVSGLVPAVRKKMKAVPRV